MSWKILLFVIFISVFFVRSNPQSNSDTYWHLAHGREIFEQRRVLDYDPFVYGVGDTHYSSSEWLSGLILFVIVKYTGFAGLIAWRVLFALASIFLLYKTIRLVTNRMDVMFLSLMVSAYVIAMRLNDRVEIFGLPLILLTNYVVFKLVIKKEIDKWAYLLPIAFLLWPNLHGLVPVGIALMGFGIVSVLLDRKLFPPRVRRNFLILALVSLGLAFIQYKRVLFFLAAIVPKNSVTILEMRSLPEYLHDLWLWYQNLFFLKEVYIQIYIFAVILIVYCLLFIKFIKNDFGTKTKQLTALFYLSLLAGPVLFYRLINPIALIVLPQLLFLLKSTRLGMLKKVENKVLYLGIVIFFVLILLSTLKGEVVGQQKYVAASVDSYFENTHSKLEVVSKSWVYWPTEPTYKMIQDNLETKRLFTSGYWGSYSLWFLPGVKTFSDIHSDFFDDREVEILGDLRLGRNNWEEQLKAHDIDTVLNKLNPVVPVYKLENWTLVYVDGISSLYARKDIIKDLPFSLSTIHLELPSEKKFTPGHEETVRKQLESLLVYDNKNSFARTQLILFYLDTDISVAKKLAEESRALLPQFPEFSLFLAKIYLKEGNCKLAIAFTDESLDKSFGFNKFIKEAEIIKQNCSVIKNT